MVCKQCWGLGVRHIQIGLVAAAQLIAFMAGNSANQAIVRIRTEPDDNTTYYEEPFKYLVLSWTGEEVVFLSQSFYFTGFFWKFIAGVLSVKVNNKIFLLVVVLLMAIYSYSYPVLVANTSNSTLIVLYRVLHGTLDGLVGAPSLQILARWLPTSETFRGCSCFCAGSVLGDCLVTALVFFMGRTVGGWASVFYLTGNMGIIWCVAWFTFGSADPKDCFYLSVEEKYLIILQTHDIEVGNWRSSIPWKNIFKSWNINVLLIISLIVIPAIGCSSHIMFFPHYAKIAYGGERHENEIFTNLVAISFYTPLMVTFGTLSDYLINKNLVKLPHQRKTWTSIAMWGCSLILVFMGYTTSRNFFSFLYTVYLISTFNVTSGLLATIIDLSPNYAGLIYGLTQAIGYLPLAFCIFLVHDAAEWSLVKWQTVIYTLALSFLVANFLYIISINLLVEPWNVAATGWQANRKSSGGGGTYTSGTLDRESIAMSS